MYVTMERLPNGNLRMALTDRGKWYAKLLGHEDMLGGNDTRKVKELLRLTDYHVLRNGIDIACLTDSPLIGDNEETLVWWYPAYEVRDCVEVAIRDGYVDFQLAPEE